MWKQLLNLAGRFWRIAEDTEQNKTEIEELRHELRELSRVVDWLVFEWRRSAENEAHELRRVAEHEAHEREKLALRLENELLRFERRLPGGKPKGARD